MIDYLIVGCGIYGATIARLLTDSGKRCLIIDRRDHIGGNIYTYKFGEIDVHKYGPHTFHTSNQEVIDFVTKYSEWIPFELNIIAKNGKKIYHLPFNMTTFYDIFGVNNPQEAFDIIEKEIEESGLKDREPKNLEEQAIKLVGKTIYETLIKGYTEKQWNCDCKDLSSEIIKRLPLRFYFNNSYFNDTFQAIPKNGYTEFVKNIIDGIPLLLNTEFKYEEWDGKAKNIIFCGAVDELLDYELGELKWRSLTFEDKIFEYNGHNGQGTPILNLVSKEERGTRIVEHMWFNKAVAQNVKQSIQTLEIPTDWHKGLERYYAVNNKNSEELYERYKALLMERMPNVILGGRLGKYRYFDMDDAIYEAINDANNILLKK